MTNTANGTKHSPDEPLQDEHLPEDEAIQKFEELREEAIEADDISADEQDEP